TAGEPCEGGRYHEGEHARVRDVDAERARGIGALRRCPHGAAVARMRQIVLQNECEDEAGSGDPEIDLPSETEPECLSARNASETQRATRHWNPLDQDVLENEAEGDRDHGKVDAAHAHAGIR